VREILLHNRYRLLDQLGSGGFGAVHRAEDTHEQDKVVAIKQINLAGLTPQQVIEATDGFNREVSLLSTLSHPHLPHIYEHFTDPDHWYLVMDFLEGETLETYLDKTYIKRGALTPLPLNEVLDIGLQLCTVLDYLHTREPAIIFRDVKPANVMRTPIGTLYLIDFGIARHYKPGKPKDTIPFGSPGYAAPEQYGKAQTSPRSDIYSLGALLHMLLSGNDPVDNPFHFDPLRLYGSEGVHELITLIEHMVTMDAGQRPQSVQEVSKVLQAASDAQTHALILPIAAIPPPPTPVTIQPAGNGLGQRMQQMMVQRQQLRKQRQQYWSYNRSKSRRKFVIGTVGVVSALALVGAGLNSLAQSNEDHVGCACAASGSSTLFEQPYPLKLAFPPTAQIQHIAWSPDGTHVALAANVTLCVQIVNTHNLQIEFTREVELEYNTTSSILALAWQPEIGGTVAFSNDETLNLWSEKLPGRPEQDIQHEIETLPDTGSTDKKVVIQSIAWSPDGLYIAFPFARGVQIWNAKTKTHIRNLVFSPSSERVYEENQITSLSWSPDGKYIAVGFSSYGPAVWRIADGKFYKGVGEDGATIVAWSPNSQFLASAANSTIKIAKLSYALITDVSKLKNTNYNYYTYYTGHNGTVTALSWSPDGRYIASSSEDTDNNLHVWTPFDVSQSPPSKNETSLGNPMTGGDYIFSTTADNNNTGVYAVAWSPDGKSLLIGTNNAYVIPLDTKQLG